MKRMTKEEVAAKFDIESTLSYKAKELNDLSSLISHKMETLRETIDKRDFQLINPLGELQALASTIDILCAEVNLLNKIQQGKE